MERNRKVQCAFKARTPVSGEISRSPRMTFPTKLARALLPVAVVATAVPVAATDSPDMARLKAHIGGVHTMTANFVQTDARGRSSAGKMDLERPGKVRFEYGSGDLLLVANGKAL